MGAVQFSEFRDEVRFLLKNRMDANVTDARIDRWINAAYRHMCMPGVHRFREMHATYDITLVSGTNSYSISETTVGAKIVAMRNVHNIIDVPETPTSRKRRLAPRNIHWFDRRTLVSSTPSVYAIEGETLHIHGVPDATIAGQLVRLRFWRETAALTDDTDTTVIPSYYDEVLQIGSQWFAERALGYREAAELTKQNYVDLLNEGDVSEELEAEDWDYQVDVNPNEQSAGMEL